MAGNQRKVSKLHAEHAVQVVPITSPFSKQSAPVTLRAQRASTRTLNRAQRDTFRIYAQPSAFVACWWTLMVLHGCEIAFLGAMTWMYCWLLFIPDNTTLFLDNLTFNVPLPVLKCMVFTFAVVGVLHVRTFLVNLFCSISSRELCFESEFAVPLEKRSSRLDGITSVCPGWLRVAQKVERIWVKWIENVFYIHGKYFDEYFFVREYLELASQVYQARQMSELIATQWINHVFVAMLFLNSVSTPLVHSVVPVQHEPLRRLLSIMCSALLNFINSVVLPLIIFVPYVQAYDHDLRYFSFVYTQNDVWYARAVRENQQLFVTSVVDFVFTLTPHWSLYQCLGISESLLRRATSTPTPVVAIAVAPRETSHSSMKRQHRQENTPTKSTSHQLKDMVLHNLIWLMGFGVLIIHILAQRPAVNVGCKLVSAPWFAHQSSCVIMNVNCHRHQILGVEQEIRDLLDQLNRESVFQLIFSHCPKLQIPPVIRTFSHLSGIDMFNVTLDEWRVEASLHRDFHPFMNYVYLVHVNLSTIPDGLMDAKIPKVLEELYFYQTNLSSLPPDIQQRWQFVNGFGFEFCGFDQFPSTLASLAPVWINFIGNPIDSVDPDLFENPNLFSIRLASPTLRTLPRATSGTMDNLYRVVIEHGQLVDVPEYLREWVQTNVDQGNDVDCSLFGNPFCTRSLPRPEDQAYQSRVCLEDHNSSTGRLNYTQIALQREL